MRVPVRWKVVKGTNDVAGPGTRHTRGVSSFTSQKLGEMINGDEVVINEFVGPR